MYDFIIVRRGSPAACWPIGYPRRPGAGAGGRTACPPLGTGTRRPGHPGRNCVKGACLAISGFRPARQYPHQLSGGQQQRVALARALAIEPSVLLLDEPLSALDAKVRLQLREQIRSLQQRLHTTTLFVTHDQEEALSMADRVGVMRSGRLEQLATPSELYAQPTTAFVAEFVGTMSRIPGDSEGDRRVSVLGAALPIRGAAAGRAGGRPDPARGTAHRSRPGRQRHRHHGHLPGSLTRISVLLSGDVTVQIDVPSVESAALAPGTSVNVTVAQAEVLVTGRR